MTFNKIYYIKIKLNKNFKREINNEYLRKTLKELLSQNTNTNLDQDIKDKLINLNNISNIPKKETVVYEDIIKNLEESEKMLNLVKDNLKIAKKQSLDITLELKNNIKDIQEVKVDELNKGLNNVRDLNDLNTKSKLNKTTIEDNISQYDPNISKIKSNNIFDIEWLQPFIDFIHNHSSLVLTIGGGLIMGGMWYMNNVGYINIGSMLTRLGITIFSENVNNQNSNLQQSNLSNSNIELPSSMEVSNRLNTLESQVSHGFFRQLGKKVLEILDVYIEKMKNKKQGYK